MTPEERKEFGDYLKRLRTEKGLSLRGVQEVGVDISATYLNQIEQGERNPPGEDKLRQLADAYGVPRRDIMAAAGVVSDEEDRRYRDDLDAEFARFERELDNAFQFVKNHPKFKYGTQVSGDKLTRAAKRFIVEMFQEVSGTQVLSKDYRDKVPMEQEKD